MVEEKSSFFFFKAAKLKRHASYSEGFEIVPNLYLGGRLTAMNSEWLEQRGIKTVVFL